MILLDGKKTSQEIKEEIKLKVTSMKERGGACSSFGSGTGWK